jgi:pyrroline-5-carboxylate reductase
MPATFTLGFLGTGKMATALAQGVVRAGLVDPKRLLGSDPAPAAREGFARATGGRVGADNAEVLRQANVVVLAVKPDQMTALLEEIGPQIAPTHLVVSIAAGVTTQRIDAYFPSGTRVIRVMPNTPALVGASATAYALGHSATADDGQLIRGLFESVGLAFEVKESLLDAVTGLSGSGPAYVYMMIEALSDGGVAAGLPRELATRLAAQTLLGAARMVLESGLHPGALKDMVTSPGGTTIEGLHELERAGLRAALMSAVRASTEKSRRLAEG